MQDHKRHHVLHLCGHAQDHHRFSSVAEGGMFIPAERVESINRVFLAILGTEVPEVEQVTPFPPSNVRIHVHSIWFINTTLGILDFLEMDGH